MTNNKYEIKIAQYERKDYEMKWTPLQCKMIQGAMGAVGEAGEVSELIKKHVFNNAPLDKTKVLNEIGDTLFYLGVLLDSIGLSFSDAMEANINKLSKRYSAGYSDEAAQKRVDVEVK